MLENVLLLLLTAGLLVYLVIAFAETGEVLMTANGWLQIGVFFALVLLAAKPMGLYMAQVYERKKTWLDPVLGPVERVLYKLTGVNPDEEMRWTEYGAAMLVFSLVTLLLTYAVERLQHAIPLWNPQHLAAVEPYLAWNTAASFTTNTNWQSYVPEQTMSYLTQMFGLATHNFWSAAVGMALAIAFIRGIARREMKTLGNFWVDLTRGTLWVLAPLCVVYALVLVSQGVIQNFKPYDTATLVEKQSVTTTGADGKPATTVVTTQTIGQGPVASQEAIKMLGTNGGGFTNANSAHPFENPTPLSEPDGDVLDLFDSGWAMRDAGTAGGFAEARLGGVRGDVDPVVCRRADVLLGRVAAEPVAAWRGPACGADRCGAAAGRQHGGQGGAVWHCELRIVCHCNDRRKLRRGERDA